MANYFRKYILKQPGLWSFKFENIVMVPYILIEIIVQPKLGFGIRNRNQGPISVSEQKLFFPKQNFFFFKNFQVSANLGFGQSYISQVL